MRIVCLSDTHSMHDRLRLPDGDILIHSGDVSMQGHPSEVNQFVDWFTSTPHKNRVWIAGNHDFFLENAPQSVVDHFKESSGYLFEDSVTIEGLKIYGSPWQPWFHDWAFNLERGPRIRKKWDLIPNDVDILVTHGPPYGILDMTMANDHVGCEELLARVRKLHRLKLHVFGHIHENDGTYQEDEISDALFVNACSCTVRYDAINPPIVIDVQSGRATVVVPAKVEDGDI